MDLAAHDVGARDGTRLRLRERTPEGADEAVLFVHGATYPGRAVFDPEGADDYSWLAATAAGGRAAFAVDVRGYGGSERPPELDEPPGANDPVVRAETAAGDVRDALGVVRERFDRVHLVGTSWGTMICGTLLAEGAAVASLVQHAPVYRPPDEFEERFDDELAAYRTVTVEEARERWDEQIPASEPASWRGGDGDADPVFDAFWRTVRSGQDTGGDAIIAPNGALADVLAAVEGERPYEAGAIAVPTLVVRGTDDPTSTRDDALALYDAIGAEKEYAEIGGGTHFVHLERRRGALYGAVRSFQERAP